MKTRLPSLITLFSLLPRLPSHKAYITQLRIKAARLQITSARFAQTAHTDNKQCNFKRAPKGNGTDTIRAPLIESIINNSMTPHGIWERAWHDLEAQWKHLIQLMAIGRSDKGLHDEYKHTFFNMQRMSWKGTLTQTTLCLKAVHDALNMAGLHTSTTLSGSTSSPSGSGNKALRWKMSGVPAVGIKNVDTIFISSKPAIVANSCCLTARQR